MSTSSPAPSAKNLPDPTCPAGGEPLTLVSHGDLDVWACPSLHGVAVTLSETYGNLQDDEIRNLWALTRSATPGPAARHCPTCARPMVAVDVPYDDDEIPEGADGDGEDLGSVPLDVCAECQMIWFDDGEMAQFPADLENAGPGAEEVARLAEIRQSFGDEIDGVLRERTTDFTDRVYEIVARHPRSLKALDMVGRSVLPDFKP